MKKVKEQIQILDSLAGMAQGSEKTKELVYNNETGIFEVVQDSSNLPAGVVVAGSIAKDGFA